MTIADQRPRQTRREFLRTGASAVGVAAFLAACAKKGISAVPPGGLRPPEAKIDGDLSYFNWAQYLDPALIKSFEQEYSVTVNQSNFHNMAGMLAKLAPAAD